MPQELNAQWREALQDDPTVHNELVHNIGNLTLIAHNSELGQKPFPEKKKIYAKYEGLQIAKTEITNRDTWNRDSIENRAKWIIIYILRYVLPIPEEMRHSNNFSAKKTHGLSFSELSLIDEYITFVKDKSVKAKVVSDNEVLFEGKNGDCRHSPENWKPEEELSRRPALIKAPSIGNIMETGSLT